jgi:hypothetical protein
MTVSAAPTGVGFGGVQVLLSSYRRQRAPLATSWIRGARHTWAVLLEAPSFYERAGIHDIKLELVERIGDFFQQRHVGFWHHA